MTVKKRPIKKVPITKSGSTVREVEMEVSNNPEIQDGVSPRSKTASKVPEGFATVGLSLGCTLNMGDFQSARIDVFIQRTVPDTDEHIKDGIEEISEMLHSELERQSAILMDE